MTYLLSVFVYVCSSDIVLVGTFAFIYVNIFYLNMEMTGEIV